MNLVVDLFTRMLLPFFSWSLCQLASATLGCKLTLVLRHPSKAFKQRVYHSWVEGNFLFSSDEIVAFTRASGRRRARKKLKKAMRPVFRQLAKSPECAYIRLHFGDIARENSSEITDKAVVAYDITEADKRIDEQLTAYTRLDILETFPPYEMDYRLSNDLKSQLPGENYYETVRSLLGEANYSWDSLRQIRITRDSKIWNFLGIDPGREPSIEAIIDKSLDFAQGKIGPDKLIALARWLVERMLALQFLQYPYSGKKFIPIETPVGADITLVDTLEDVTAQLPFLEIEAKIDWEIFYSDLPASQRRVADIYLEAEKTGMSVREICERDGKDYQAVRQGLARIKKKHSR